MWAASFAFWSKSMDNEGLMGRLRSRIGIGLDSFCRAVFKMKEQHHSALKGLKSTA
jgi:hypothetical protein